LLSQPDTKVFLAIQQPARIHVTTAALTTPAYLAFEQTREDLAAERVEITPAASDPQN
jgi:hypothetical protein